MLKRRTHEQFVKELKEIHPNIEVITPYIRLDSKIIVRDLFGDLEATPLNLLRGYKPSVSCALDKSTYFKNVLRYRHPKLLENIEFLTPYTDGTSKVHIKDKYCNYLVSPSSLLKGCYPTITTSCCKNTYFTNKAREVHGNKYDYSKVEYVNCTTKICIICPTHGEFWQNPSGHLKGYDCFKCPRKNSCGRGWTKKDFIRLCTKKLGYGTLYQIRIFDDEESFYKVGITSKTIKRRFIGNSLSGYSYEIVDELLLDPATCWRAERQILKDNKHLKYLPKVKFAGWTECFSQKIIMSSY